MTFNEAKLQQLNAAGTYRVYGQALEFAGEVAGVAGRRGWRPIRPCLCVQDFSRQSLCVQYRDVLVAVENAVVAQGNSGRKDHHGKNCSYVLVDSKIMVSRSSQSARVH